MTTATQTIADFLLARVADDEAAAREAHYDGQRWYSEEEMVGRWPEPDCGCPVMYGANRKSEATHIARHDPARVLAECEAKRAIIELAPAGSCENAHPTVDAYHPEGHDSPILLAMAQPYADHPDFDPSWR